MSKISEQERIEFDELYQYIKKEIFEYDDQVLPKYMILRLKGFSQGKFMANNNTKNIANYSYPEILYTFKINKLKIKDIVNSGKFKNEQRKFNTIMIVIEREINDVVNRLKKKEESNQKIERKDLKNVIHEGAEYKPKNNKKISDELKDLW